MALTSRHAGRTRRSSRRLASATTASCAIPRWSKRLPTSSAGIQLLRQRDEARILPDAVERYVVAHRRRPVRALGICALEPGQSRVILVQQRMGGGYVIGG